MSLGFIILTLKKNDWACNTGTLHLLSRKIQNSAICREDFLTVFWNSQRVYTTEFLEVGNTVNSARYIETIKNLRRRVCRVRRSTSPILLLHDNARLHTARATIDALETLKFEVLSHPPYSPDLAPSISISFLTSTGISRGLISPQMMKWSKLWRRGSNKELLNSLLTA